jgi:cyclopropane fatty-acyl-phospholipid synthase-like methyltransferase
MLILRHLTNEDFDLPSKRICDLGSGSGHWIDFYLSLGASQCTGIDISRKATDFLDKKFAAQDNVVIHTGRLDQVLQNLDDPYDLVNVIGVMFHLVEDEQWLRVISEVARILNPGGLFVVGGHFGLLNNLNVQFNSDNKVNKRLRSAAHWKRTLRCSGFGRVTIYRNRAYLSVRDSLPENNLLVATKM